MNLIVDVGQSGSRARLDEEIFNFAYSKNTSEALIQTLEKIFAEIGKESFSKVYLSLTGLQGNVGNQEPYGELCKRFFGCKEVAVMDDGIAAFAGAIGLNSGVVLTLGGGVVAISSHDKRFGHADGKGPIFGDFGGGFWMGQYALRKAIATQENRDTAFDLVELFSEELTLHQELKDKTGVEAAKLCIYTAQKVCAGAEANNTSALNILGEGADYLSKTIVAAWRQVSLEMKPYPMVAFLGGLSKSQIYVNLIKERVSRFLTCDFVEPIGDHLVGAPLIAESFKTGIDPLLKWWRN